MLYSVCYCKLVFSIGDGVFPEIICGCFWGGMCSRKLFVVVFCEEHTPRNYLWLFLGRNVFSEIICGVFLRRTCSRKLFVAVFGEECVLGNYLW
jgi:hypothetical protein